MLLRLCTSIYHTVRWKACIIVAMAHLPQLRVRWGWAGSLKCAVVGVYLYTTETGKCHRPGLSHSQTFASVLPVAQSLRARTLFTPCLSFLRECKLPQSTALSALFMLCSQPVEQGLERCGLSVVIWGVNGSCRALEKEVWGEACLAVNKERPVWDH